MSAVPKGKMLLIRIIQIISIEEIVPKTVLQTCWTARAHTGSKSSSRLIHFDLQLCCTNRNIFPGTPDFTPSVFCVSFALDLSSWFHLELSEQVSHGDSKPCHVFPVKITLQTINSVHLMNLSVNLRNPVYFPVLSLFPHPSSPPPPLGRRLFRQLVARDSYVCSRRDWTQVSFVNNVTFYAPVLYAPVLQNNAFSWNGCQKSVW